MENGNSFVSEFGRAYNNCKLKCAGYPNTDCPCSHADFNTFKKKGKLVIWESNGVTKYGLVSDELLNRSPSKDKVALYETDSDHSLKSNGKGKPIVLLVDPSKLKHVGYTD